MTAKYGYVKFLIVQFYLILCARFGWSAYIIPEVRFEVFSPKGITISIPDERGVKFFAFHGRINGALNELEPGELSKDVTKATKGRWVFNDPDRILHVGDTIGYWVFVQNDFFGYRKDNMTFRVTELINKNSGSNNITEKSPECTKSITVVNGKSPCIGDLIFQDAFEQIDHNKWTVEKYIPKIGPNFEFNYYTPECVAIKDYKLKITPVPLLNQQDIRGTLNFTGNGCTRNDEQECSFTSVVWQYLPPVKSGKIKSKFHFKYGRVQILAKLPCGDWIYPEISLIPRNYDENDVMNMNKIVIAYSRGNEVLSGNNNDNIGGTLLFAGYASKPQEPDRSKYLSSKLFYEPLCRRTHSFTLVWKPDQILAYFNEEPGPFGNITIADINDFQALESSIHLGVSVGGINDFPNDYRTADQSVKPWSNKDPRNVKTFFDARNTWIPTWSRGSSLDIYKLQIYAL